VVGQCYHSTDTSDSNQASITNDWTGMWTGTVEWTMEWTIEFFCTVDSTIFQCIPDAFIPL